MSGSRAVFLGDAMAAVVQAITEVRKVIGRPPVIVGGLAVMARLMDPYRATVDLDLVDRLHGGVSQLEVRQVELDRPSDDPGDRLHASAPAWAYDTATEMTIEAVRSTGDRVEAVALVALPGPLVAMKLQAVMNRAVAKHGTDLLDIVRLVLDDRARPMLLAEIGEVEASTAADIAIHVDLWFVRRRQDTLRSIRGAGGDRLTADDVALVSELLAAACERP